MHMKNLRLKALTLTIIVILCSAGSVAPGAVASEIFVYPGTGGSIYAKLEMTPSSASDVGSVLMIVKVTPGITTQETSLSTYQHQLPVLYAHYDLEHANTGTKQTVQLNLGSSAFTVHASIISFEETKTLTYSFSGLSTVSSDATLCDHGTAQATSIYCTSPCNDLTYSGAFCDVIAGDVQKGTTYLIQLQPYSNPRNYYSFTIPGSNNKVTLFYISTGMNIMNFVQFKQSSDEIAGWTNHVKNGGKNEVNKPGVQYSVTINSGGKDIAISFWNANSHHVSLTIWYTQESSSSILLIVLAVLGGILFILLAIVAIYVVKKMNSNQLRQVQPHGVRTGAARQTNSANVLSATEIETYFPSVLCKNIYPEQENSSNNLMTHKSHPEVNEIDRDCVICLCPVVGKDMMKVTFCRHIFHDHCLAEWFKKNRNCPYCREEFNKKATIEHYQALLQNVHKTVLIGVNLVQEIVHSKSHKSSIIVEEIKD